MSWSESDPGQGSPDGIAALASRLGQVAEAAASAQANLQKLKDNASDAIWRGSAADAFRDRIDKLPGHLQQLAQSYADARDGFGTYSASVREIADQQRVIEREIGSAQADHSSAAQSQQQYAQTAAASAAAAPAGAPASTTNPYDAAVAAAQQRLSAATQKLHGLADDRRSADSKVKGSLKDAHNAGMKNKSGWAHFWESVSSVLAVIAVVLIVIAVVAVIVAFPAALAAFAAADGLLASLAAGGAVLGEAAAGGALGMAMTGVGVASLGTEGVLYSMGEGSLSHLALDTALTFGPFALVKGARYLSDASAAARGLEDLSSASRAADDLPGLSSAPRVELNSADTNAIADYSGAAYIRLNQALRSGDSAAMTSNLSELSDNLSSALSKLPDYQGLVYRGTTLDDATLAKYVKGQSVTELGFTSSSTDSPFAGNTPFTILSSSGKDISALSSIPGENEVLFDKGTRFIVVSHDTVNGVHRINLKEIP